MAWTTTSNELAGKIAAPVNRLLLDLDRALGLKVGRPGPDADGAADDLPGNTIPPHVRDLSARTSTPIASQSPQSTSTPREADSESLAWEAGLATPASDAATLLSILPRVPAMGDILSPPLVARATGREQPQQGRPYELGTSLGYDPNSEISARDIPFENVAPTDSTERQSAPVVEAPMSFGQSQPRILRILPLTRRRSAPMFPGPTPETPGASDDVNAQGGDQALGPVPTPKATGNLLPLKVARTYRASNSKSAIDQGRLEPATSTQPVSRSGLALPTPTNSQGFQSIPGFVSQSAATGQVSPGPLSAPPEYSDTQGAPKLISNTRLATSHSNNLSPYAQPMMGASTPNYLGPRKMTDPTGAGANRSGWLTLFPLEVGRVAEKVTDKLGPSLQQADRLIRDTLKPGPMTTQPAAPPGNRASNSRVQNNFNVSVSIKGNGSEVDLDPEVLEEAIVNVLKDAARRHGLEV